jgi:hypothetical protein
MGIWPFLASTQIYPDNLDLAPNTETHRMIVNYNGLAEEQPRRHYFRWILYPGAEIEVAIDKNPEEDSDKRHKVLQFSIKFAEHDSCQDEYQKAREIIP